MRIPLVAFSWDLEHAPIRISLPRDSEVFLSLAVLCTKETMKDSFLTVYIYIYIYIYCNDGHLYVPPNEVSQGADRQNWRIA